MCACGKDTVSGPRSERRLISAERLVRRMSDLVEAIEAEARSDFAKALGHYARLTESGSALDRVGIFQALARCNEKLGRLKDAGTWRRRAGQGYLALMDDEMARDERQYLALVEYRNAVQDLHGDPSLSSVAKEYAAVLKDNFSGGAEGLTHEGLFAGAFFRTLGDHLTAAKYFFDTAEAMSEQATTGGDPLLREATILAYERAMDSATKAVREHEYNFWNLLAASRKDLRFFRYDGEFATSRGHEGLNVLTNEGGNVATDPKVQLVQGLLAKTTARSIEDVIRALQSALRTHASGAGAVGLCVHFQGGGTVSSTILALSNADPGENVLLYADGSPCTTPYRDYRDVIRALLNRD